MASFALVLAGPLLPWLGSVEFYQGAKAGPTAPLKGPRPRQRQNCLMPSIRRKPELKLPRAAMVAMVAMQRGAKAPVGRGERRSCLPPSWLKPLACIPSRNYQLASQQCISKRIKLGTLFLFNGNQWRLSRGGPKAPGLLARALGGFPPPSNSYLTLFPSLLV